jgi:hypothetical protein
MVQPFHLFRFVIYINHIAILLWMLRHFHCGLWQCDASFAFGEFMDGCCWVGAILVFGCFFFVRRRVRQMGVNHFFLLWIRASCGHACLVFEPLRGF